MHRQKINSFLQHVSVWQNNRTTFFCAVASAKSDKQLQENAFLMYKSWPMYNTEENSSCLNNEMLWN